MLNVKLLWSYVDYLNVLKNEVVLSIVPIFHLNNILKNTNNKDLLNIVSQRQSYPRLLVLQTLIGIYIYLVQSTDWIYDIDYLENALCRMDKVPFGDRDARKHKGPPAV